MILDASTSFASTCLSAAESVDRSAVMLVGANRAAIFCNLTVSDTTASCATPAAVQHTAANTVVAHLVDMGTFYLSRRGWRLEVRDLGSHAAIEKTATRRMRGAGRNRNVDTKSP